MSNILKQAKAAVELAVLPPRESEGATDPASPPEASTSTRRVRPEVILKERKSPVLPVKGEQNVLITSALPYVNNAPHLGNIIGSTLSADVFARYSRTRGRNTLYICGTDEYGTTTETKALEEGLTERQLCDRYYAIHKDAYDWFELGFDHFGRTSTPKQTELCQDIFVKLYKNGHMEEQSIEQLYCEKDKKFLADRFVEGKCPRCGYDDARGDQCDNCTQTLNPIELINPRCKICGASPTPKTSSHLFIKLNTMQPQIEEFVKRSSGSGHWSANGKALTDAWLKRGLEARCMTRDLKWGVPVPLEGWESKVMYVWFDAPIGYPSITAAYTDSWELWWKDPENVKLYQFMGKDNVPFHSILFPAYLLGTGEPWTLLDSISTTEYLQYENAKFSKSRGVGVFGQNARETGVPASVWRYYLIRHRPETSDYQFTWNDFIAKNNSELLGNLGNFVNRLLKFVAAKYNSVLPDPEDQPQAQPKPTSEAVPNGPTTSSKRASTDEDDDQFVTAINTLLTEYIDFMESQRLRPGLETVMKIAATGNEYVQGRLDNAAMLENPRRCARVVLYAVNLIYLLTPLTHPFMPAISSAILQQLDAPARTLPESFTIDLLSGHTIGKPEPLFKLIDPKKEHEWRTQFGGKKDGAQPAVAEAPSKKAAQKAKAKAAAAAAAEKPAFTGPKTPELIELEKKVVEQGEVVRKVKAEKGPNVAVEVEKLLDLKKELERVVEKLSKVQVTAVEGE